MAKYEPTSFFFTDYNPLTTPTITEAFGPLGGNSITQYRTTSFVNGSGKLYAICNGRLMIQPQTGSTDKVNLILKPEESIGGLKIKYFIYRNVNKSDLINGDNLSDKNDSDPNQPDFLKRLWKEFHDFNIDFYTNGIIADPPDEFPASLIGYRENPDNTLLDFMFGGTDIPGVSFFQLPSCKKGEFIGNYSSFVGLDIVLDFGDYELTYQEELFRLDLIYACKSEHIFDTNTIANSTPVKIKRYREHILQFMDAAAFWGSHIDCGTIETISGDKKTAAEIGNDILSKYYTKNKIYVHIQGENERSYNYYDTVRKVYGFDPLGELATTYEWPIIIKQVAMTESSRTTNFKLEYEIEGSNDPMNPDSIPVIQRQIIIDVFGGNGNPLASYPKIYRPETTSGQTEAININFYGNGTQSYTTFLFLYGNLKQKYPVEDYFNSLWSVNIDVPFYKPSENETGVYYANYNHNRLVNLDDTMGVGARIQNKIVFDEGLNEATQTRKKRRLYMAIVTGNSSYNAEYNGYNISEITAGKYLKSIRKEHYSNAMYNDTDFAIYRGTFTDLLATPSTINSLCLVHHKNILKKKSYYHLGITDEEYNKLIYDDPVPTSSTPQYLPTDAQKVQFYLEEVIDFLDDPNATTPENTRKFRLGISFENDSGVRNNDTPLFPNSANEVYVYTIDGFYFFSKDFSNHQEYYTEFADSRVEFRPVIYPLDPNIPVYTGEFGFDYLRIEDFTAIQDIPLYKETIESGYNRPSFLGDSTEISGTMVEKNKKAYRKLTREYKTIASKKQDLHYYATHLSLFSKTFSDGFIPDPIESTIKLAYQANLQVIVDIDVAEIGLLEFEWDTEYFDLSHDCINNTTDTFGVKLDADPPILLITCKKDFAIPQQILVWQYPKNDLRKSEAKLAGVLLITKNDINTRIEQKIVLVKVRTNTTGLADDFGDFSFTEKMRLVNGLGHGLIYSSIVENISYYLNLTGDDALAFQPGGIYVNQSGQIITIGNFFTDLKALFLQGANAIYENYFIIFSFGVESPGTAGEVEGIGKKCAVLFSRNVTTLCHEALHGLKLRHTHRDSDEPIIIDPNQKYIFPYYNQTNTNLPIVGDEATDNIMSYNRPARKSSWYWQWKIINPNIK